MYHNVVAASVLNVLLCPQVARYSTCGNSKHSSNSTAAASNSSESPFIFDNSLA
eukprot:CAMPEP_0172687138 /NCGR_PEP_ID=MMETSP1074-20121228/21456_1 /TAXON_ID=2916 /ORGANISM="Ceratium fusus, Strain PA161109" /LENGTH=53 /DNA_ID=CAMNT_0013506555 /DNA_START=72 /DNA_END=229 /DNA_ORIENTATION=-